MTDFTTDQLQRIDQHARDLVSGQRFRWAEASQRSRGSYYGAGPIGHLAYSKILSAVGRFASQSDRHADTACRIVKAAPLYNTEAECLAKVAGVIADVCSGVFYDAVAASGPNPGRRSDHEHATDLRWALQLELLWSEIAAAVDTSTTGGVGWCTQALLDREHMTVYQHVFPTLAAIRERRAAR